MTDKTAREILREWSFVERCGHYPHTEVEKPCPHCAHTILAALEAGGFAVVPKEPGDDVRKAMYATWDSFGDDATMGPREAVALYRAALAASNPKEEGK